MSNYGKIADGIALVLMAVTALGVIVGTAALWIFGAPLAVSIGVTLFVLAVAAMELFAAMDRRNQ